MGVAQELAQSPGPRLLVSLSITTEWLWQPHYRAGVRMVCSLGSAGGGNAPHPQPSRMLQGEWVGCREGLCIYIYFFSPLFCKVSPKLCFYSRTQKHVFQARPMLHDSEARSDGSIRVIDSICFCE